MTAFYIKVTTSQSESAALLPVPGAKLSGKLTRSMAGPDRVLVSVFSGANVPFERVSLFHITTYSVGTARPPRRARG